MPRCYEDNASFLVSRRAEKRVGEWRNEQINTVSPPWIAVQLKQGNIPEWCKSRIRCCSIFGVAAWWIIIIMSRWTDEATHSSELKKIIIKPLFHLDEKLQVKTKNLLFLWHMDAEGKANMNNGGYARKTDVYLSRDKYSAHPLSSPLINKMQVSHVRCRCWRERESSHTNSWSKLHHFVSLNRGINLLVQWSTLRTRTLIRHREWPGNIDGACIGKLRTSITVNN